MDAAKAAAARLARPNRSVGQLKGLLKVRRKIVPFAAVPTTAGTGSETTIAAVVTDETHHKYAVNDLCLIPRWAILDPTLMSLPAGVTAETGLDALTHAVEAYIGRFYNTRETRSLARQAVAAIFSISPNRLGRSGGQPCIPGAGNFQQGGLYPRGPPGDAVSLGN